MPAAAREKPLTQRQKKMLSFIQEFTSQHSFPPSIREITVACRISSPSVTDYNLRLLEHRNFLTRKAGSARSIVLTEQGRSWPSPVASSSIREDAA